MSCNFKISKLYYNYKTKEIKCYYKNIKHVLLQVHSIHLQMDTRLLMRKLTILNNSTGSHNIVIECASFDKYPYLIDVCNHDVTYLLQSDDVRKEYLMKRDNITKDVAELVIETFGDDESKIKAITKYHDESLGCFRVFNGDK